MVYHPRNARTTVGPEKSKVTAVQIILAVKRSEYTSLHHLKGNFDIDELEFLSNTWITALSRTFLVIMVLAVKSHTSEMKMKPKSVCLEIVRNCDTGQASVFWAVR